VVNCRKLPNARQALAKMVLPALAVLFCPGGSVAGYAQTSPSAEHTQAVPFDAEHWVLDSDAEIGSFEGRTAMTGAAYVKGVSLRNGTIETDIWTTEEVNFAGLSFHVRSFEEQESIWLRTHKTNGLVQDGLQYAPAYHGVFCWQLNPQGIAPANLPKNQWVHLKLVLLNGTATLYVRDMTKPVMVLEHLQLGHQAGSVGLWTLRKADTHFSNFSYQIGDSNEVAAPKQMTPPNVVADWQLSPSYPIPTLDAVPTAYPARQLADVKKWIVPEVDASGLVNITRYHGTKYQGRKVAAGGPDWTILRAFIDAKKAGRIKMNFGYSDAVTIFLNGAALFSGNNGFLSRNKSDGEWISFNDAVFLNLKKGRNELLAVVADDFGGWGFQAKIDDVNGIKIHAKP